MNLQRRNRVGKAIAGGAEQKIGIDTCKKKWRGAQPDQFGVIGHVADAADDERLPGPSAGCNCRFVSVPNTRVRVLSRDPKFGTEIIGANSYKIYAGQSGYSLDIANTKGTFDEYHDHGGFIHRAVEFLGREFSKIDVSQGGDGRAVSQRRKSARRPMSTRLR